MCCRGQLDAVLEVLLKGMQDPEVTVRHGACLGVMEAAEYLQVQQQPLQEMLTVCYSLTFASTTK